MNNGQAQSASPSMATVLPPSSANHLAPTFHRMSLPNILSPPTTSSFTASPPNIILPYPNQDLYLTPALRQHLEQRFFEVPNFLVSRQQFQRGLECMRLIAFALVALQPEFANIVSHNMLYLNSREKVRAIMDDEAKLYPNSSDVIRTWTFIGLYEFYVELYPRSWISIGTSTRLVTCDSQNILDLPSKSRWKDRTNEQIDETRALFWHVFMTDRMASWVTGFSPGLSVMGIRNYLCDDQGISTNHRLQDDWRGKNLPVFAYLAIGASFFERNENLHKECFYSDDGRLPHDVVMRRFENRSLEIHEFQSLTSANIDATSAISLGASLVLQIFIQAALLQLYTFAVDHDLPFHGRLKFSAFRSFLQLGSIDADFGVYNVVLYHTLFKAGCALVKLFPAAPKIHSTTTSQPSRSHAAQMMGDNGRETGTSTPTDHEFTRVELSQGLVIILSMLHNLSHTCPGAKTLIKQLESGMDGQKMKVSIPEMVSSRNQQHLAEMQQQGIEVLESGELDKLLEMFSQAAEQNL